MSIKEMHIKYEVAPTVSSCLLHQYRLERENDCLAEEWDPEMVPKSAPKMVPLWGVQMSENIRKQMVLTHFR